MFESSPDAAVLDAAVGPEDWFDPAWLEQDREPVDLGQIPAAECAPSGWLGLELDHATVDAERLSDAELIDAVVGFDRMSSWAAARQARLLAEFARRRLTAEPVLHARSDAVAGGREFAADEVGLALRLSRTAAATRLAVADRLVESLPGTLAAWEAGQVDVLKVRAITDTAAVLPVETHAALEARILPRAPRQTLAQLRAALARAVLALDPGGAAERHAQRRAERRVVCSPEADGMATLWALLSAPDALAAHQHLGELARALGADDPRGMDARRADLLVDLLTGRALPEQVSTADGTAAAPPSTDSATGASGRARPRRGTSQVSVIVPITMLMGLDEQPGELVGYGPVPAPLAREIAAEGTWRRLLTDPVSGALLDCGRTTYTPPAGLADFVRARDVYCRRPGCGQRAATADLDHTVPWPEGGTGEHNLHAGCRHDHLIKTFAPGWSVKQFRDGRITWTTPTGHAYTSHPYDYRTPPGPAPPDGDPPPFS